MSDQQSNSTFIKTFAQELLSSTRPERVIDHYEKQLSLHYLPREQVEAATKEAYELLYWKYKELNGQSVDTKFVEAYNILIREIDLGKKEGIS